MDSPKRTRGWRTWLATAPAIGVALVPRFT
jgi:hypothetical protein